MDRSDTCSCLDHWSGVIVQPVVAGPREFLWLSGCKRRCRDYRTLSPNDLTYRQSICNRESLTTPRAAPESKSSAKDSVNLHTELNELKNPHTSIAEFKVIQESNILLPLPHHRPSIASNKPTHNPNITKPAPSSVKHRQP
ncbi:hypothetical protein ASPTUDRAFT_46851 [Aspergillus tubingensis CBS 134.48]|uniref:Uncharacterized protein n=1 Tax=Aspergillus tubingensis (strain CBS 134.48) TaxID=767770 RepID=A0A1L9MWR3_ASPTC|nr:hypothetical protein ASPTUDRAFT_46851 [Aspergillus tubingensis CBS 134.48]